MERWVLFVDTQLERYNMLQAEWNKFEIYVHAAPNMPHALELLLKREYLLVVIAGDSVDYMPLLKLMREMKPMPILILALAYNAQEKVDAIRLGADEYIAWPVTAEEWQASARALIRRYTELNNMHHHLTKSLVFRDLLMLVEIRKVFFRGQEIHLSKNDYNLLQLLLTHPGRVYTFEQIYSHLYEYTDDALAGDIANAVRCQIKRLRKKMRAISKEVNYIISVREVGYTIAVEPTSNNECSFIYQPYEQPLATLK